jgi:CBS domain-containing protein
LHRLATFTRNDLRTGTLREFIERMRLDEIMVTPVVSVDSRAEAGVAWSRMQQRRIRHLVVTDHNRIVGVVSDRDLGGPEGGNVRRGRVVEDLMTPQPATAGPNMTLREAANLMRGRRIGSLPVLDDKRLVGIVTATDVLDELGRGRTRPQRRAGKRRRPVPASSGHIGGRPVVRAPTRARAKTGRARRRKPDSAERSPFAAVIPKQSKLESGGEPQDTPAHIRVLGTELGEDDRRYIRRKLGMKLGKFASAIERVSVRVEDVNGPRGGVDHVCRVKIVLGRLPSVVVEKQDASRDAAIDDALAAVERAVRRSVRKRHARATRRPALLSA